MGEAVRLLPGEVDSSDLDDVEHWIEVYTELAGFARDLVLRLPASELDAGEHHSLVERVRWLNERLEFWRGRRTELMRPASSVS